MIEIPKIELSAEVDEGMEWAFDAEWIAQEKIDGFRALLEFGKLRGFKAEYDLPGYLPPVLLDCVFDGELKDNVYHVFDVVVYDGADVRRLPLSERLSILTECAATFPAWMTLVSSWPIPSVLLLNVISYGGEGIVRKKLSAGWGKMWVKCKREETHDIVIASIDREKRSAACYQFQSNGDKLDVGRIFLGSATEALMTGDVIEVFALARHASGKLREARLFRVRNDKPAAACVVTA